MENCGGERNQVITSLHKHCRVAAVRERRLKGEKRQVLSRFGTDPHREGWKDELGSYYSREL